MDVYKQSMSSCSNATIGRHLGGRKVAIARRVVLTVAGLVLLLSGYIASWGAMNWLFGRAVIDMPTYSKLNGTIYSPLILLMDTDTIASRFLLTFSFWCTHKGHGGQVTFSEFWQAAKEDAPAN
jgi:hypothetical protein